jgi:hypothetical protein
MSARYHRGGVRRACTCGETLGIQRGNALHITAGESHIVIRGLAWVLCGVCRRPNTLNTCPTPRTAP